MDKPIDVNDKRIGFEGTERNADRNQIEIAENDGYYSSYKERIDQTPTETSGLGTWEGVRGESKFIPADAETQSVLEQSGVNGIEYKNGIPDFDPVTKEKVQIEMTKYRWSVYDGENYIVGNFDKADSALAEKWNQEKKDGREDWTKSDVKDWVTENQLTRHENNDMKTVSYIPYQPHVVCPHLGGVAECRKKEMITSGGSFDE